MFFLLENDFIHSFSFVFLFFVFFFGVHFLLRTINYSADFQWFQLLVSTQLLIYGAKSWIARVFRIINLNKKCNTVFFTFDHWASWLVALFYLQTLQPVTFKSLNRSLLYENLFAILWLCRIFITKFKKNRQEKMTKKPTDLLLKKYLNVEQALEGAATTNCFSPRIYLPGLPVPFAVIKSEHRRKNLVVLKQSSIYATNLYQFLFAWLEF